MTDPAPSPAAVTFFDNALFDLTYDCCTSCSLSSSSTMTSSISDIGYYGVRDNEVYWTTDEEGIDTDPATTTTLQSFIMLLPSLAPAQPEALTENCSLPPAVTLPPSPVVPATPLITTATKLAVVAVSSGNRKVLCSSAPAALTSSCRTSSRARPPLQRRQKDSGNSSDGAVPSYMWCTASSSQAKRDKVARPTAKPRMVF
jgi:hypothetical protein